MDKHFPSDVHRTPELLIGNAKCTGVLLETIDSHGMCEKDMCRGEFCEFGCELLQLSVHALTRGVLSVEGRRCWLRQQGCKEMVDALGVEEGGKLGEDLWCRNAQRDNMDRNRLASQLWHSRSRGLKNGKICTVRHKDNVVCREERDLVFGGSRDLARIDCQHMGTHVSQEVIDNHR